LKEALRDKWSVEQFNTALDDLQFKNET